jgi:hypothetical protein
MVRGVIDGKIANARCRGDECLQIAQRGGHPNTRHSPCRAPRPHFQDSLLILYYPADDTIHRVIHINFTQGRASCQWPTGRVSGTHPPIYMIILPNSLANGVSMLYISGFNQRSIFYLYRLCWAIITTGRFQHMIPAGCTYACLILHLILLRLHLAQTHHNNI